MAMRLRELTGIEPFSIDQTQFLELHSEKSDAYHQLIASFQPTGPMVLVNRANGSLWSAQKELYDVNVILPLSVSLKSFGEDWQSGAKVGNRIVHFDNMGQTSIAGTALNNMLRPSWLDLDGQRQPVPIKVNLCRGNLPCVVEARYADESANAIVADRYAFLQPSTATILYLRVGHYRLDAFGKDGKMLSEQLIDVLKR
jgi:hypothetical protein